MNKAMAACPHCGLLHTVDRDEDGTAECPTVPCADPMCQRGLCDTCRTQCFSCDQWNCREHMVDMGGELWCRLCWDSIAEEADQEYVELTEQTDAERFAMLASAGLSLEEFRAAAAIMTGDIA